MLYTNHQRMIINILISYDLNNFNFIISIFVKKNVKI